MANINIYGKLVNATPEGILVDSEQIKDTVQNKKQSVINSEVKTKLEELESRPEGVSEYSELTGKPQIGGVELVGNLSFEDLGLDIYQTIDDDSLTTSAKTIPAAINEIKESVDSVSDPYEINLTNLLSAEDSESISTAIGGIDNLNATVQDNRIIVGTISNGNVSVSIRILGNVTTLYYLLDSVVGLTLNEIAITNTSGTLTKTANTHAVLTENMVVNNLESDETTLPLSAAQGKHLGRLLNISIQHRSVGRITDKSEIEEILGITASELGNYKGPKSGRLVVVEQSAPNMADAAYERVFYSVRYQSDSHSFNWTFIPITDTLNTYKRCTVSMERSSGQFYSLDINEGSTTDLQNLDKAIGQPYINTVDLSTPDENGYYWNTSGAKAASADYSIKYVNLSKGDLLIANIMSSDSVAQLTVVDSAHIKAIQTIDSAGESLTYVKSSFLADRDCIVAISYYSRTAVPNKYAYIVKSSQNTAIAGIATSTAALHKIYEGYGAVYNADTGYWELEGLIDLTEEDMFEIYLFSTHLIYVSDNSSNSTYVRPVSKYNPRLVLLWGGWSINQWCFNGYDLFANQQKIEKVVVRGDRNIINLIVKGNCAGMLMGCTALKDAGLIYLSKDIRGLAVTDREAFRNDIKLNRVLISRLSIDISFKHSQLISYESIKYLVDNAANTAAITVTVHPTTYSYLTGTAQPTEEVGGTTEEWQALVTTAQGKQISFAVPEETQSEVTE